MLRAVAKNPPLKEDLERWPRPDYGGRVKGKWDLVGDGARRNDVIDVLTGDAHDRHGRPRKLHLQHAAPRHPRERGDPLDLSPHATPAGVPKTRPQNWIPVYTGMTR